jgi:hypothetical protein
VIVVVWIYNVALGFEEQESRGEIEEERREKSDGGEVVVAYHTRLH